MNWNITEEHNGWAYRITSRTYIAGSGWDITLMQYDTGYTTREAAKQAASEWMVKHNDWV